MVVVVDVLMRNIIFKGEEGGCQHLVGLEVNHAACDALQRNILAAKREQLFSEVPSS